MSITIPSTNAVADLHSKILDARPPGGPNSFNFMQFLGKFGKIVCWHPQGSWRPLLGEILDPPLQCTGVQPPTRSEEWK